MLTLANMTQTQYLTYKEKAVSVYAIELEQSGLVPQGAGEQAARQQFDQALPQGAETENFYLYNILNTNNEHVGLVIYGQRAKGEAFIIDIQIFEEHQQKGYGKKAMTMVEDEARNKGYKRLSLHVFGHNKAARALYEKRGFETLSMQMSKDL